MPLVLRSVQHAASWAGRNKTSRTQQASPSAQSDGGKPRTHSKPLLVPRRRLELRSAGCGSPPKARVLFTTHSMIEKRCERSGSFGGVAAFHYQGEPRAVRICDEAILPGQPLTISRDDLALLFAPLRGRYTALADAIEDLFTKLKTTESGTVTTTILPPSCLR